MASRHWIRHRGALTAAEGTTTAARNTRAMAKPRTALVFTTASCSRPSPKAMPSGAVLTGYGLLGASSFRRASLLRARLRRARFGYLRGGRVRDSAVVAARAALGLQRRAVLTVKRAARLFAANRCRCSRGDAPMMRTSPAARL